MIFPILWVSIWLCLLVNQVFSLPLNSPLLDVYDYIVVGGGVSGLTVANRLSEDANVTVLVLEAGQADHFEEDIMVPVFVGADIYSTYDWYFQTVPQTYLDGATRRIPQGRALGGGSILNAMLWNRGGQGDYDDWERLGNPGWGWQSMLPYFMRSETYTPETSPQVAAMYGIQYNPAVHGYSGPVNVSFQHYFYNTSANFFEGLNALGVPTVFDPNDGASAGATYLPLDINPSNQSRADARRSYYDPYAQRHNLYVSTGQYVTQIVFEHAGTCANNHTGQSAGDTNTGQGNGQGQAPVNGEAGNLLAQGLSGPPPGQRRHQPWGSKRQLSAAIDTSTRLRAIGVEYAASAASPRQIVRARREVILAAGSLQTPKLLELSGIGSRSTLNRFNITTLRHLPGVGNNLQDHQLVGTYYQYFNTSYTYSNQLALNATLNQLAMEEYYANRTGPWTAGPADGNAFPSLQQISNRSASIVANARQQNAAAYLAQGLDSTIVAGYNAQLPLLRNALADPNRAVIELLNSNAGNLSPSNMRPFSRGHVHINSSDPFVPPAIDPRYGSNPIDLDVLYESLLFNRRLLQTTSMIELQPYQWAPPVDADESALRLFLANGIGTEYHPSGTCAMLPQDFGGVVDPSLLIYGTSNLRVVDASIFPILPAAHLQAVVYGVAEKAADIIRAANTGPAPPNPQLPGNETSSCWNSTGTSAGIYPSRYPSANGSSNTSIRPPRVAHNSSSTPARLAIARPASQSTHRNAFDTGLASSTSPGRTQISADLVPEAVNYVSHLHPSALRTMTTGITDTGLPSSLVHQSVAAMPPVPGPFAGYSPIPAGPANPHLFSGNTAGPSSTVSSLHPAQSTSATQTDALAQASSIASAAIPVGQNGELDRQTLPQHFVEQLFEWLHQLFRHGD